MPSKVSSTRVIGFSIVLVESGIDKAIVAGFDWGARTADVMAALWRMRRHSRREYSHRILKRIGRSVRQEALQALPRRSATSARTD
jgi:hypothetical protein